MSVIFSMVKSLVSITHVASIVGLTTKEQPNGQLRAKCSVSESDDERAIVITPSYNLFNCFACDKGGSQLDLYAHIMRCTVKEAAEALMPFTTQPLPVAKALAKRGFSFDKYAGSLDYEHAMVTKVFPSDLARELLSGYSPTGLHQGRLAIPVRLPSGKLIGWISGDNLKYPKTWDV